MGSEAEKLRQRIMNAGNPSRLTLSDESMRHMIEGERRIFSGLSKKEIKAEKNRRRKLGELKVPGNGLQPDPAEISTRIPSNLQSNLSQSKDLH